MLQMTLSKRTRTDLNLSSVLPERIPNLQITRDTFEAVCANEFARIKRPLDEVRCLADDAAQSIDASVSLMQHCGRKTVQVQCTIDGRKTAVRCLKQQGSIGNAS